jgi:hypothetical protein
MSQGGLLLDGSGDIAMCSSTLDSLKDMVRTRLKAELNAWKLYAIGADLNSQIGEMAPDELEPAVQRLVRTALSRDFLPSGGFSVETLVSGSSMTRCRAPLAPVCGL